MNHEIIFHSNIRFCNSCGIVMTPKSSQLPCIEIEPYDEEGNVNFLDMSLSQGRFEGTYSVIKKSDRKSLEVISDKLQEAIDNADNTVLCKSMIWSARGWLDEFIRRFE